MKAVVSNRIYLEVTQEYKDFLDKELTYTIASYNPTDPPLVIKNMSRIRTDLVSIPIGRLDLIPNDYEVVDKREHHKMKCDLFRQVFVSLSLAVHECKARRNPDP